MKWNKVEWNTVEWIEVARELQREEGFIHREKSGPEEIMRGVEETQIPLRQWTVATILLKCVESSVLKQKSGFPGGPVVKLHTSSAGSMGSIPSQVDHNP